MSNFGDIRIELKGKEELEKKLNTMSSQISGDVALRAVNTGAAIIETKTKLQMDKVLHRRTGMLINSVSFSGQKVGKGAVATIRVGQVYGKIHEYGGTIVPIRARMLHWVNEKGEDVFARKVTIPARPYMRPAIAESEDQVFDAMGRVIDSALKGSGK
jgi:phage gpG-like protein